MSENISQFQQYFINLVSERDPLVLAHFRPPFLFSVCKESFSHLAFSLLCQCLCAWSHFFPAPPTHWTSMDIFYIWYRKYKRTMWPDEPLSLSFSFGQFHPLPPVAYCKKKPMKGFLSRQRRVLLTPPHLSSTSAILWAPSLQAFRRAKLQQSDLLPAASRDRDGG